MDKKQIHHLWTAIRPFKVWYFVAFTVVGGAVAVGGLRHNNLQMVTLRDQVYQADQKNEDVEGALQRLRSHVYGHMNTDLSSGDNAVYPPVQLKYTYERLRDGENKAAQNSSSQIYTEAQRICEEQNPTDFSGRNRVPCIEQYVSQHGVKAKTVPDALYKFDFASPSWSPDLAGFALLFTALSTLALLTRIAAGIVLPRLSK